MIDVKLEFVHFFRGDVMERDGIVADAVHTLQQDGMYSSCGST